MPATAELRKLWTELKARRARSSIGEYTSQTFPNYKRSKHQDQIDAHLEALERRDLDRLIIIEPPRHGKSLKISQRFPAWYLGRHPRDQVIHCSYGGELVSDFGRDLRNLMASPEHGVIFPKSTLSVDSQASHRWHTTQNGVYVSAGVGGPITGRGGHLGIIDDPVKSREEADSQLKRDRTWKWYQNDFYPRLMRGGLVVVVSTRWHEDDLVGRLLEAEKTGGDKWTVLHHPAINKAGEALWPEEFPLDALHRIRGVLTNTDGTRAWQALYQGDPTPDEGVYFKKEWIRYGVMPNLSSMKLYGASDYATKDGEGDYTVHGVVGIDDIGRPWLVDLWREQTTADKWITPVLDFMEKYKPVRWLEEKGQIINSVGPFLLKEQMARKIYTIREQFNSSKDKATRARSFQGYMGYYGLWLPSGAIWASKVESEVLKFPAGAHDDIVDVLSLVGRAVAGLETGAVVQVPDRPLEVGQVTLNQLIEQEERRKHNGRF